MSISAGEPVEVHARVFVPGLSVPEDPATGSAAAGLGMVLAQGLLPAGGRATACHVSGGVHPVSRGMLRTPPGSLLGPVSRGE